MMVRAVVVAAVAVAVAVAVSAAVAVDSLVRSIFLVLFGSLFCLGNTQSDDGCSSRCSTESGFRCSQLTSPTLCAPFEASSFISVVLTRSANRTTGNATGVDQWSDATVDQLCRLLGVNELRFRLEVDTSEELRLRVSQPYAADPPALNAAVSNRRRQDTSIYRAVAQTSDKQTADDLVAALAGADPVTLGSFGVTSEARVDNTESSSDPFPPGAIAGIVVFAACCCCLIVLGAAVLIVAILIQRRRLRKLEKFVPNAEERRIIDEVMARAEKVDVMRIDPGDLLTMRKLGAGEYGVVTLVMSQSTSATFVFKQLVFVAGAGDTNMAFDDWRHEVDMMLTLTEASGTAPHPHLLRLVGVCDNPLGVATEQCQHGA